MKIDVHELQVAFFEDADDHIEKLELSLNLLATEPNDTDAFDTLFRSIHTIKGDSAAVGFESISELMHQCESTLQPFRQGSAPMNDAAVQTIGMVVDQLNELVAQQKIRLDAQNATEAAEEVVEFNADPETLHDFISETNEHVDLAEEQLLIVESDPSNKGAADSIYRSFHSIKGLSSFLGLDAIRDLAHQAESILNLAREDKLVLADQSLELVLASVDAIRVQLGLAEGWLATGQLKTDPKLNGLLSQMEAILQANSNSEVATEVITEALTEPGIREEVTNVTPAPRRNQLSASRESIKVDRERLDHLINVIGELVIGHAMLEEEIGDRLGQNDELSALERINKTVRDLQELSLSLRMVPVAPTFQKMARIVRDLARKLGKEIHFETDGEETELDKTVVDQIGDPLLHMVRNAVDHGLESPSERRAAGKASHGTVSLRAYHRGGNIYVEIQDDGRGLDREQIRRKAIERKIISLDSEYTDDEILELIFAPGFSTASEVTDVSGRGVGMDVVRKSVEALHGNVAIQSELGVGTTITIRLPLTLAILDGLSVRVGVETYILPILSVVESYSASLSDVHDIAGKGEVVTVRGEVVPLIRLQTLLQDKTTQPHEKLLVVIVEERGRRYALLVDELLGQSQVVIKNLQTNYRRVEGVSGATILGNGKVAMILDLCGLFALSHRSRRQNNSVHCDLHQDKNTETGVAI